MISLSEALAAYPREIKALPTESIALNAALHRVLREPAHARCDLPRFSQSALDGYVLTNQDAACAPSTLKITDSIAAGDGHVLRPLVDGECQRILTGARVPPDAGAVVAQERVSVADGVVTVSEPLKVGANIRWQGEELRKGAALGAAGQRLTPGLIAALAMAGVDEVDVTRAPRIVVLVSGDEIKPLGTPLAEGQIWDSNGPLVLAWLQARGYAAVACHLPDTRAEVECSLQHALSEADLVITTGGVSVGDKDYILPVAEQLGVRRVFWQVAQKPGKPIYFGVRDHSILLGLPGNPGAVLIGLALHVRMALDLMAGAATPGARFSHGALVKEVKADARRDCLHRMRLEMSDEGRALLHPLPHQDSHMLSNLASADVLVRLPAQTQAHVAGSIVRWTPL